MCLSSHSYRANLRFQHISTAGDSFHISIYLSLFSPAHTNTHTLLSTFLLSPHTQQQHPHDPLLTALPLPSAFARSHAPSCLLALGVSICTLVMRSCSSGALVGLLGHISASQIVFLSPHCRALVLQCAHVQTLESKHTQNA